MGKVTLQGAVKPNAALVAAIRAAATSSPYDVEIFSGTRGNKTSQHGQARAVDLVLITPDGTRLPNLKSRETFSIYETFAKSVHQAYEGDGLRWGGYFGTSPLNAGGFDLMHFDVGSGKGMSRGTWEGGLTPAGKTALAKLGPGKIYSSQGIVNAAKGETYANLWGREDFPVQPAAFSPALPKLRPTPAQTAIEEAFPAAGVRSKELTSAEFGDFMGKLERGAISYEALPPSWRTQLETRYGTTDAARKAYEAIQPASQSTLTSTDRLATPGQVAMASASASAAPATRAPAAPAARASVSVPSVPTRQVIDPRAKFVGEVEPPPGPYGAEAIVRAVLSKDPREVAIAAASVEAAIKAEVTGGGSIGGSIGAGFKIMTGQDPAQAQKVEVANYFEALADWSQKEGNPLGTAIRQSLQENPALMEGISGESRAQLEQSLQRFVQPPTMQMPLPSPSPRRPDLAPIQPETLPRAPAPAKAPESQVATVEKPTMSFEQMAKVLKVTGEHSGSINEQMQLISDISKGAQGWTPEQIAGLVPPPTEPLQTAQVAARTPPTPPTPEQVTAGTDELRRELTPGQTPGNPLVVTKPAPVAPVPAQTASVWDQVKKWFFPPTAPAYSPPHVAPFAKPAPPKDQLRVPGGLPLQMPGSAPILPADRFQKPAPPPPSSSVPSITWQPPIPPTPKPPPAPKVPAPKPSPLPGPGFYYEKPAAPTKPKSVAGDPLSGFEPSVAPATKSTNTILNPEWSAWEKKTTANPELRPFEPQPKRFIDVPVPKPSPARVVPARQIPEITVFPAYQEPPIPNLRPGVKPVQPVANSSSSGSTSDRSPVYDKQTPMGIHYNTAQVGGNTVTQYTDNGKTWRLTTTPDGRTSSQQIGSTSSSGGASAGSTVLCTHFMRKKWLSVKVWRADVEWSLANVDKQTYAGYLRWAGPCVRRMERGGLFGKLLEYALFPVVRAWAYDAAFKGGAMEKSNLFGKVINATLAPLSWWLGREGEQNGSRTSEKV